MLDFIYICFAELWGIEYKRKFQWVVKVNIYSKRSSICHLFTVSLLPGAVAANSYKSPPKTKSYAPPSSKGKIKSIKESYVNDEDYSGINLGNAGKVKWVTSESYESKPKAKSIILDAIKSTGALSEPSANYPKASSIAIFGGSVGGGTSHGGPISYPPPNLGHPKKGTNYAPPSASQYPAPAYPSGSSVKMHPISAPAYQSQSSYPATSGKSASGGSFAGSSSGYGSIAYPAKSGGGSSGSSGHGAPAYPVRSGVGSSGSSGHGVSSYPVKFGGGASYGSGSSGQTIPAYPLGTNAGKLGGSSSGYGSPAAYPGLSSGKLHAATSSASGSFPAYPSGKTQSVDYGTQYPASYPKGGVGGIDYGSLDSNVLSRISDYAYGNGNKY